ncbi:FAD-dependent oxidoreductase [Paraburkholderia domus]|jgi:Thioredoxin reductase|uniref:Hydrogen cyanide synthase subunit HcnB n=1 Tax=Paraburkholderia domus TaxID=2793075 RepID=A0A9N8R5E8_9BURK|nr:FAD-dependent oxidoreductase [Paraburkholderia domus]MBK5050241.1 FAD-dependent oxidoreductase [Burkholderia sp. R-70006]MBK5168014.1 FAD-dependent oxidoreductase [Burkholderia sp. R-70211]CAE6717942.1 Hydrogen cyanide synthase subunit HcnB [Paraburkholderia domus]CAE6877197.1 Hydrogen cyanide synthase subunit HcnB [Paraburkholderia domus]CAE6941409.1 Hydrogen cyanide synthase subunit HcnB [Paraburkholderia domus]
MKQHFDIVVVGAGPAGLTAAQAAAREGATVALLDDNPRAGGQIWRQGPGHPPQAPLHGLLAALKTQNNVTLFPSTRVIAPLGPRGLLLESAEQGGVSVSYDRLILATGARERLLPFAGWTLPGVTGAGALQALIKGGMPVRGERIVIAGSGPLLVAALATARAAGAQVVAVVEQASALEVARFGVSLLGEPAKLRQAVAMTRGFAGVRYWTGSIVRQAHGDGRVERVTIRRGQRELTLDCERIACGYGLVPNITLAQALGCAISEAGEIVVDGEQRTSVEGVLAAGESTGVGGAELAGVEGEIAGLSASGALASRSALHVQRARWRRFGKRVEAAFALQAAARTLPDDATLLCRCEDVSIGEVRAYPDWREAKLHTRCGMGACQGRICGAAAGLYFGWQAAAPRPPFSPAEIGTLMAASAEQQPAE